MCMIESKVYVSSSGSEWEQEIAHPCTRASAGRLCSKIERKTTRAGLISRGDSQRRTPGQRDAKGDRESQSYSARRQERRVVVEKSRYVVEPGSPISSGSSAPCNVYPAAPSPPLQSRHSAPHYPEQGCPMMSGGLGSDAGARPPSPSYDFITDKARLTQDSRPPSLPRIPLEGDMDGYSSRDSRRKVSLEIPAHNLEYVTPRLDPPPLRRKSVRLEHKRNDSAKVLPTSSREQSADREARLRAAEERAERHQQQSRERYEAHMDAVHRRQDAADDARLRREEQEMERQADQERLLDSLRAERYSPPPLPPSPPLQRRDSRAGTGRRSERQRLTEAAAHSARKAGERVQRSEKEERERERRLESERRAAARERRESDARHRDREWAVQRREDGMVGPAYSPQRTVRAPPIIHYSDGVAERLSGDTPRARGAEIIASEQARLAREELAATMHDLALNDPFARDFDTGGQFTSDSLRAERLRTSREDQRRRLDM